MLLVLAPFRVYSIAIPRPVSVGSIVLFQKGLECICFNVVCAFFPNSCSFISSLVGFQDLPNFNEPFNVKGGVLVCVIQMCLLGL
jgi:hypothetical protein